MNDQNNELDDDLEDEVASDEFDDDEDFGDGEIEIKIEVHDTVLAQHGITPEQLDEVLGTAIDEHLEQCEKLLEEGKDIPEVSDLVLTFGDRQFQLKELADVSIVVYDDDEEDEFDDDFDDDEDDDFADEDDDFDEEE